MAEEKRNGITETEFMKNSNKDEGVGQWKPYFNQIRKRITGKKNHI